MDAFSFILEGRAPNSGARAGILTTPHGVIHTPAFVPVATKADVKGLLPEILTTLGTQVVLANTYHLYLQPGEEIVRAAGGLSTFMGWEGPTMTDSGGFQVFSLGAAFGRTISKFVRKTTPMEEASIAIYDEASTSVHGQLAVIDDEGVSFTSHLDGSLHRFTPERSVEIQHALGADLFFAFDECTSPTAEYSYQKEALERTHRWAMRSLIAHRQNITPHTQAIFGIIQGGRHEDLRRQGARTIAALGFDGFGIGGSFSKEDLHGSVQAAVSELPEEFPRHFLGIGEPGDVLEGIEGGMDLFDCVAATRLARHGTLYTRGGLIHLTNERYRDDFSALDPETIIPGTESFTRAYVAHLLRAKEMTGQIIASIHNIGFMLALVDGARQALLGGRFEKFRADFLRTYYG